MATSAAARPGSQPGDYLVVGPGWKGETPAGIKKIFYSTYAVLVAGFRTQLSMRPTCRT
jgi:hypothetical protein